jgi:hypothetical protein
LIPARNRRHLMLDAAVVQAVAEGRFHVHTAAHAMDGLALLTGQDAGLPLPDASRASYPPESLLGRAERALVSYRRSC